ncbi:hypothetical protein [Natranaerobius trueperi]|uniref:Uncharacterized protein n=1 Tax=Natranaerobius trueperi TaxID=759412 RepID=A0A226BWR7_9FIRM|nr:hypothetical protein [Natranaerobius trueperi]OWZ83222.1 hypothetical protein CDO51_09580 [Natranaerobius trueperi]
MFIEEEIFKGIRNVGKSKKVKINLFPLATDLFSILKEEGLIEELNNTPLLGNITVRKKDSYTRYDYVMMQQYMYLFVKKKLNSELMLSLGNKVKCKEFTNGIFDIKNSDFKKVPTIADILQILALIYNIGHFKNTFTSSRAAINAIKSDEKLYESFLCNFEFDLHKNIARQIIESNNYYRFHLLNSLLILLSIGRDQLTIKFAINILSEYLTKERSGSEKLEYIFKLFVIIREVSFVTYDLSIAPVPIYIDIHNDKYLETLLMERLSGYNEEKQISNLFKGLNKLLQDNVYNEESNAIIQFDIVQRMTRNIMKHEKTKELFSSSYQEFINGKEDSYAIFNKKYSKRNDFEVSNILKLSFSDEKQSEIIQLIKRLNSTNFVKVAWYYSMSEERIIMLVAIKAKCNQKQKVAFKVIRVILNFLNRLKTSDQENTYHDQVLLTTKFFLYYLFNEHKILLEGGLDKNVCVTLDQGKRKRSKSLKRLLTSYPESHQDNIHEIKVIKSILDSDNNNDLGLTVCSSIVVKDQKDLTRKKAEFDGLILYPNRNEEQIIFVESKNTNRQPSQSKNCLKEKFITLAIPYVEEYIVSQGMNSIYKYSV